jgi:hypothetical protein
MSIANVSTFQKEDKEEFEQCLLLFFDSSRKNFRVVYVYVESRDQIQKEISGMHIKSDMGTRTRAIILPPISLPFATRTKIVYPLCLIFDNAEGMSLESG